MQYVYQLEFQILSRNYVFQRLNICRSEYSNIPIFHLLHSFSTYSEITILFLSGPSQGEARRYCLALDSIVTLLSRCLSPVIYSYSLKDFNIFCLSYVDDKLFKPVFKGLAMMVATSRITIRRVRNSTIRIPEFSLLTDSADSSRTRNVSEVTL